MKRSVKLLLVYEDEISSVIHQSLDALLNQLRSELKSSKQTEIETDAHFLNLFFIIFELSVLSDPNFIFDIARLFYLILSNLSIDTQAKFVRLLSKYSSNLRVYITHVQQYITLYTLRWCEHTDANSDDDATLSDEPGIEKVFEYLSSLFC